MLTSEVQNCCIPLEWMIQYIVFVVWPLPHTSTLHLSDVIHVMNETRPFPIFDDFLLPCIMNRFVVVVSFPGLGMGLEIVSSCLIPSTPPVPLCCVFSKKVALFPGLP